ncbi:hypothetical protein, partial [Citrobacter youngae]
EKRVFLVILFTSFSGSLVSRIPGAVQVGNFFRTRGNRAMKKAVINVDKTNPLPVLTDSVTRVSIQCTAKDENGAGIEVNILDLIQDHDTAEVKVQFGSSPVQALAMLRRVMTALEKQANAELNTNHYSRMQ